MTDKEKKCCEKNLNECHCAFRCLGGEFCDEAEKRIKTLQAKLDIAVKALEKYAKRKNWQDIELYDVVYFSAQFKNVGYENAEKALAKIKEIK